MKITIDTEAIKKTGTDIDLALYLISLYLKEKITDKTFEQARQRGLIRFEQMYQFKPFPEFVHLSEGAESLVESILAETNLISTKNADERFKNLANKLREIFPQGKKTGTSLQWRDSESVIMDRLKKFILKYGDHPDEEIIDATKRYVDSFNGQYTYMQVLKYFIWKNKISGAELVNGNVLVGEIEKQSQLAAYIENKESDTPSIDWDIQLK